MKKTLLSWSSGKDSAWALHLLKQDPDVEIVGLFTTLNEKYDRVCMHASRNELLQCQAEAVGLPVEVIYLPNDCTNEKCDEIMAEFVKKSADAGIECMAYGDLYLDWIRKYREDQLKGSGITPLFPLWGMDTTQLAEQMLDAGVETYISCVDMKKLPAYFAGQRWSKELLGQLPEGCDPCGENGEMHTIVVNGPMFQKPVSFEMGKSVKRGDFAFADIIPS